MQILEISQIEYEQGINMFKEIKKELKYDERI